MRENLEKLREQYRSELYDSVMPFWMKHSLDPQFGGYLNCLDRDGTAFDSKKHIWLQARQVWMLSRIHNSKHAMGEQSEWLTAATMGADFLRKHARSGNRVFFALSREGRPIFMQRKMFSECFYVMALAEYARASGDDSARTEAREMLGHVIEYARNPALLGRPVYDDAPPASELAVPMILLNLLDVVNDPGENNYADLAKWCVERVRMHVRSEFKLVLETVSAEGAVINSPEGRLVNPGHAIEAGWFLMQYGAKTGDNDLVKLALKMIDWSFEAGWDEEHGGLYYFLDRDGYSPLQLEWSMKLWWPHCEALVAFMMAWRETGKEEYLLKFRRVHDYTFQHFSDREFGEWFGYLDREGRVSQRFKGGPYKGCFHVPRSLFMVEEMLAAAIAKK